MPKKPTDRLKLNMDWGDAAGKLIRTPAKSTPKREVTPRKKSAKKKP